MKQSTTGHKLIAQSDSMPGSWVLLILVSEGIIISALFSFEMPDWLFWTLPAAGSLATIFAASWFFLNRTAFYPGRIERQYFIPRAFRTRRVIDLQDVMAFRYTNNRADGGNGTGRIYYRLNGQNRTARCSMSNDTAIKVCDALKEQGVPVDVKPSWVLPTSF